MFHDAPMRPTRMTREVAEAMSLAEQHEWFRQQRSRRSVLKGGLVGAGSWVAGTAMLSHPAGAAGVMAPPRLRPSPVLVTNSISANG